MPDPKSAARAEIDGCLDAIIDELLEIASDAEAEGIEDAGLYESDIKDAVEILAKRIGREI
jgi:hypothetical protein